MKYRIETQHGLVKGDFTTLRQAEKYVENVLRWFSGIEYKIVAVEEKEKGITDE